MTEKLLNGSGNLLRSVAAWANRDGFKSAVARWIGTLLGMAFAVGILLGSPALWWPLSAAWIVSSWFYANPTTSENTIEEKPDSGGGEGFTIMDDPEDQARHIVHHHTT